MGVSSILSLIISNETAGRYFCKAHSPGFQEISAEALVTLRGPPKITSSPTQYPLDEETYEIECLAHSVPKVKHISWAFNGNTVDFDKNPAFSLRQFEQPDGIKSILHIEENHLDHLGTYTCTVVNKYGSDTLDISFSATSMS